MIINGIMMIISVWISNPKEKNHSNNSSYISNSDLMITFVDNKNIRNITYNLLFDASINFVYDAKCLY